jgi:hypothetical protein
MTSVLHRRTGASSNDAVKWDPVELPLAHRTSASLMEKPTRVAAQASHTRTLSIMPPGVISSLERPLYGSYAVTDPARYGNTC